MNPALRMIIARQRVADIRRMADRGRQRAPTRDEAPRARAPFLRLPDGSWIYHRRDSC
jgi:hypothetical protein